MTRGELVGLRLRRVKFYAKSRRVKVRVWESSTSRRPRVWELPSVFAVGAGFVCPLPLLWADNDNGSRG